MENLFQIIDPLLVMSAMAGLFLFTFAWFGWQAWSDSRSRGDVKKRLDISRTVFNEKDNPDNPDAEKSVRAKPKKVAQKVASKTNDFYSTSDPKTIRKMQLTLIQAGFLNPNAVGYFLASRVAFAVAGIAIGILLTLTMMADSSMGNRVVAILGSALGGYFLPNFYVNQRRKKLEMENRQGFPDVMDLMVVSAEAGLTTEASIDRIAKEISRTYPTLSQQLNIVSLEVRAGRPLDQALRAFGERLGLDEIQGFATMIQQSKELGTSVSEALKVYSDEMRHKRMMAAEEKAYALPAKMSVPVTVFILPIVIGVAVTPTVVRIMTDF